MIDRHTLDKWGELHVILDSGDEYHLHKHDVHFAGDRVYIDSKLGDWEFSVEKVEQIDYPHSHKE